MAPRRPPPTGGLRPSPTSDVKRILRDPVFIELVRKRTSFAWMLSGIILVIYLGFIFLVAFAKPLMATAISGVTSLGIVLGLFVIVAAFFLTGVYVQRANTVFDAMTAELKRSAR